MQENKNPQSEAVEPKQPWEKSAIGRGCSALGRTSSPPHLSWGRLHWSPSYSDVRLARLGLPPLPVWVPQAGVQLTARVQRMCADCSAEARDIQGWQWAGGVLGREGPSAAASGLPTRGKEELLREGGPWTWHPVSAPGQRIAGSCPSYESLYRTFCKHKKARPWGGRNPFSSFDHINSMILHDFCSPEDTPS